MRAPFPGSEPSRQSLLFECGLVLRNFQDIKEGDIVEAFEMREIPRS